jgi:hypothetical protein
MTAAEVAAALYAFSDLMDDVPEATSAVVRDEISFVVARYGMAAIERVTDWIASKEVSPPVQEFLFAVGRRLDRARSHDRLDWCHKHVALAFGAEGT